MEERSRRVRWSAVRFRAKKETGGPSSNRRKKKEQGRGSRKGDRQKLKCGPRKRNNVPLNSKNGEREKDCQKDESLGCKKEAQAGKNGK